MTFEDAVLAARSPVPGAFRQGLKTLGAHSTCVSCSDPRRFTGSVDLDSALSPTLPSEPRWDYGLGLKNGRSERAVWVEVHPATTNEAHSVLAKLGWLKAWLREHSPDLDALTQASTPAFFWVATEAGVHITANSPQARLLQKSGLGLPKPRLVLP